MFDKTDNWEKRKDKENENVEMKKEFILDEDCYRALAYSIYGYGCNPDSFMYNGYTFKNKYFILTEESKLMTREEAIDKVLESGYSSMFNRNSCKQFINTLEALGLIKFKERELFKIDEWNAVRFLKSLGYTVRKNG